jgi:hypothetical protein
MRLEIRLLTLMAENDDGHRSCPKDIITLGLESARREIRKQLEKTHNYSGATHFQPILKPDLVKSVAALV